MAKGFEELDEWVHGLEVMAANLAAGMEPLFAKNDEKYLGLAQRVGGQWLLLNVPNGVDPEIWSDRVGDFINLVFSRISGQAFEIFYQGKAEADAPGSAPKAITYQDVLEWVKAGPEKGGKNKTLVEHSKAMSDEQIAHVVANAINQYHFEFMKKDYSGIAARLEQWVDLGVLGDHLDDVLPAVLETWFIALDPMIRNDCDQWLNSAIAW